MLTHQRAKVCLRLDQPLAAAELFAEAARRHPADTSLLLGQARIQEALGQHAASVALYQQVCLVGWLLVARRGPAVDTPELRTAACVVTLPPPGADA